MEGHAIYSEGADLQMCTVAEEDQIFFRLKHNVDSPLGSWSLEKQDGQVTQIWDLPT